MTSILPAEVGYFTEVYEDHLGPGEAVWKTIGPSEVYSQCAVLVTAHAFAGVTEGLPTHVLKVDDVNVTLSAGVVKNEFYLGFNVINNGNTTIRSWGVTVGLIGP